MRSTISVSALALVASTGLATILAAGPAAAQTVVGLQGKQIVWIDAAAKKVVGKADLAGGATLVGIDVRPADGQLYGLTPDGTIVTIDPKTGKWQEKSKLSEKLPAGATFSVDFNPVADRLRVIGSDGTSLRINVDDGKTTVDGSLKYADADTNKGKTPKVTAAAYTNSVAGTKETALYDIDLAAGTLVKQAPPNDGILNTIGALPKMDGGAVAFDIVADGKGGNSAWVVAGGALHSIDLATGKVTTVGKIAGLDGVTDIAALPAAAPKS